MFVNRKIMLILPKEIDYTIEHIFLPVFAFIHNFLPVFCLHASSEANSDARNSDFFPFGTSTKGLGAT